VLRITQTYRGQRGLAAELIHKLLPDINNLTQGQLSFSFKEEFSSSTRNEYSFS
jgi:hypothetical protein